MAFDPAIHRLVTCSTPLARDGSQLESMQPCSLDNDAADTLENLDASKRRKIIMDAVSEWRRIGPGMLRQNPGMTWRNWTNAALTQAGLFTLAPDEVKEYDN